MFPMKTSFMSPITACKNMCAKTVDETEIKTDDITPTPYVHKFHLTDDDTTRIVRPPLSPFRNPVINPEEI